MLAAAIRTTKVAAFVYCFILIDLLTKGYPNEYLVIAQCPYYNYYLFEIFGSTCEVLIDFSANEKEYSSPVNDVILSIDL